MTIASNKASAETESYIDISKNYDEELIRLLKDGPKSAVYNHYLSVLKEALRKANLKARDGEKVNQELVRIGLYAEDMDLLQMLPEWLVGSLDTNSQYFGKLYKPHVYADDREEEEDEEEEETNAPKEYEQSKEVVSTYSVKHIDLNDITLEKEVDKLKSVRSQQIKEMVEAVTSKLLNSEMATSADVVIALGENKKLKQFLSIYLNKLGISVTTTAIAQDTQEVVSKRTNFDPNESSNYSLETLKNGLALASGEIEDLFKARKLHEQSNVVNKALEAEKNLATKELSKARSEIEHLKKMLELEKLKPSIKDCNPILYRIAWDDEGVRYYLGTSDTEDKKTTQGVYRVASLIKSTKKTDSIKFSSIDDLKVQLEKAIKYYKNIDRKQIISLESLKNAYVLQLIEYADNSLLKTKIIRNTV